MSKTTKKVIVNGLSLSRIIGALCLPFVFMRVDMIVLIIILSILFLTDCFDGKLARKWKVQTMGGCMLDPLGDKILPIACIFSLTKWYHNMWFLLFLELAICILIVVRAIRGESVHASYLGKFKMWVLCSTLVLGGMSLFCPTLLKTIFHLFSCEVEWLIITNEVVEYAIMATIGVEILTFALYMRESMGAELPNKREKLQFKSVKEIFKRLFDEESFEKDKDKSFIEILTK